MKRQYTSARIHGVRSQKSFIAIVTVVRISRLYLSIFSLLENGYRVFPVGKVRPGRAADHLSPSSAAVIEE